MLYDNSCILQMLQFENMKKVDEVIELIKNDCPLAARFFMNGMKKYCAEIGLTHIQGGVLLYLLQGEQHFSQTEVSGYIGANASAISRMLDDLEESGLVKRELNEDNRREHVVVLTDIGKAKALALDREITKLYAKMFEDLTEKEFDTIKDIFGKIKRSIA